MYYFEAIPTISMSLQFVPTTLESGKPEGSFTDITDRTLAISLHITHTCIECSTKPVHLSPFHRELVNRSHCTDAFTDPPHSMEQANNIWPCCDFYSNTTSRTNDLRSSTLTYSLHSTHVHLGFSSSQN